LKAFEQLIIAETAYTVFYNIFRTWFVHSVTDCGHVCHDGCRPFLEILSGWRIIFGR